MGNKRKRYKLEAIRFLESGTKPGHQIEHDLGIGKGRSAAGGNNSARTVIERFPRTEGPATRNWQPCARRTRSSGRSGNPEKSNGHLLQTAQMKYAFMSEQRGAHSVEKMADVLEVARSGFYAWLDGEENPRAATPTSAPAEQGEVDGR